MKRLLAVFTVAIITAAMLLAGCSVVNKRSGFFNKDTLERASLEKIPKADYKFKGEDSILCVIYGDISKQAFNEHAQLLFEYMDQRFERLGIGGRCLDYSAIGFFSSATFEFLPVERKLESYKTVSTDQNGNLISTTYEYIYFTEEPTEENDWGTREIVYTTYYYKPQSHTVEKDGERVEKFTYNYKIGIRKKGSSAEYCDVGQMLARQYYVANYEYGEASVLGYYGTLNEEEQNFFIAQIKGENEQVPQGPITEVVADTTFVYPDGNAIKIAWRRHYAEQSWWEFWTLTDLFNENIIDENDVKDISERYESGYLNWLENKG